jgi:hypothetical protein
MRKTIEIQTSVPATVKVELEFPLYRQRVMTGNSDGRIMVYTKFLSDRDFISITAQVDHEGALVADDNFDVKHGKQGYGGFPFYGQGEAYIRGEGQYAYTADEFERVAGQLCHSLMVAAKDEGK